MSMLLPGPCLHDGDSQALVSKSVLAQIASHAAREVPGVDHLVAPRLPNDSETRVDLIAGGATTVSVQIVVRTAAGLLQTATGVRDNIRAALSHMAGLAGDVIVDIHVIDVDDVELSPVAEPCWVVLDEVTAALAGLVDDAADVLLAAARHGAEAHDGTGPTPGSQVTSG
ncbi:hypothetical protein [Solicola sp. PLA-1-18]|uniref:hypothetical protein n=1 Tax=Solicola sp. PLA-1-18 TaxID=3380532 RepID=UPI003B7E5FA7